MKPLKSLGLTIAAFLFATTALAGGSGKAKEEAPVEMVSRQLLVKFKTENAALERTKVFKKFGGVEVERVGSTPLFLVQFAEDSDVLEIKSRLEHEEGVSYAEPNLVMRALPVKPKLK